MLKSESESYLLRIFLSEASRFGGRPLYQAIVYEAQRLRLAGATVLRGIMGFGAHSHLNTSRFLRLTENLSVVIEIVDKRENLDLLIPFLDEHLDEGLVTIEPVHVIQYASERRAEPPSPPKNPATSSRSAS